MKCNDAYGKTARAKCIDQLVEDIKGDKGDEAVRNAATEELHDRIKKDPRNKQWVDIIAEVIEASEKDGQKWGRIQQKLTEFANLEANICRLSNQTATWERHVEDIQPNSEDGKWVVQNLDSILKYIRWLEGRRSLVEIKKNEAKNDL